MAAGKAKWITSREAPLAANEAMGLNWKLLVIAIGFSGGYVLIGQLRALALSDASPIPPGIVTPLYVFWTIGFAVLLQNEGVLLNRLGTRFSFSWRLHIGLALLGLAVIKTYAGFIEPAIAAHLDLERDLSRFSDLNNSLGTLAATLVLSWTVAALGEEIAFRVLLLQSFKQSLNGIRFAGAAAVILQALVFASVHAYQGPLGMLGAGVSGLVYGGLALASGGALWAPALCHGLNNSISLVQLYYIRT